MNDDAITDLKQFIATTVSQQTTVLTDRIDKLDVRMDRFESRMDEMDKRLSTQIEDLQTSVAEALDTSNDAVHAQLTDHEQRLITLEAKPV